MNGFLHSDFLLDTEYARILYHKYAKHIPMPYIHSNISPSDISKNKAFSNITEFWICSDEQRQRGMRACGCEEKYITGEASDYDKFREYCRIMPELIGSAMYCFSHLELRRYFDCDLVICPQNCERIWNVTAQKLSYGGINVMTLLERSDVKMLLLDVDPCDSLSDFERISESDCSVTVKPTFSPCRGLCIENRGIRKYIERLSERSGVMIAGLADLERAYMALLDRFESLGCRTASHSASILTELRFPDPYHADLVLKKALASDGSDITPEEAGLFRCQMMRFFGIEYKKRGIVMQLYLDRKEEGKADLLSRLGEGSLIGISDLKSRVNRLASLLNYLCQEKALPKTLVSAGDISEISELSRLCADLRRGDLKLRIDWHTDSGFDGLKICLGECASASALGKLCGMIANPERVFMNSEYECFRRVLCSFVGEICERGLCPWDEDTLGELIFNILYRNETDLLGGSIGSIRT